MKKRAALHNLGCKVNEYETEAMQQLLEEAGYEIVPFQEKADVYVINTCSVTNIADRKSRQMLHRAKRKNPDAIVVAAGCYAQTAEEKLLEDDAVDIVIGNNRKGHLLEAIDAFEKNNRREREVSRIDINDGCQPYETMEVKYAPGHTRAFLKVQDGCNQFCSYCIIPYARGRVRSRDLADAVKEAGRLAESGYREIVLTGIHLSSYQTPEGDGLLELVEAVCAVPGIARVRLGSLEPQIVTEDFALRLSELPKVCPHFHLSLQSGCDATLKRMNRKYDTAAYEKSCGLLRKYFSRPAITTDVIAGFPGESEEEFAETKKFLEKIRFYEMHVFKYSRRKGTVADRMPDQVDEAVKTERSAALLELAETMSEEFRSFYVGKWVEILLEEPCVIDGVRYMTGFTREYVKVAVKTEEEIGGSLVSGKIAGFLTADLLLSVEFSK